MSLLGSMAYTEYGCVLVLICALMMISAGNMIDSGGPVDKDDPFVDKDEEAEIKAQLTERED